MSTFEKSGTFLKSYFERMCFDKIINQEKLKVLKNENFYKHLKMIEKET